MWISASSEHYEYYDLLKSEVKTLLVVIGRRGRIQGKADCHWLVWSLEEMRICWGKAQPNPSSAALMMTGARLTI